jgi:hypothetical protein
MTYCLSNNYGLIFEFVANQKGEKNDEFQQFYN